MKEKPLLYLFVLTTIIAGCSSNKQSKDNLAHIDANRNYPEKEIILTDIADISYLHLNSDNDDYLYKGGIASLSKNTIVVFDSYSGNILFFSEDGNPKSQFNRRGRGPEEYLEANYIIFDESSDDVFVASSSPFTDFIQVYSSTGKHKRKISLPGIGVGKVVSYDEGSLLVYDSKFELMRNMGRFEQAVSANDHDDSPFMIVSKTDGKILDYIHLPQNNIILRVANETSWINPCRVIRCPGGILLCNPETDTVFRYNIDKSLTPVMYKTPFVSDLDPMVILNNCVDVGNYQFIELITLSIVDRDFPIKYYVRDKRNGEVYQQKLVLPEYKGKVFFIGLLKHQIDYENGAYLELDLLELKQAYRENKLSGKLKELVATLKDDDNNVFVRANFK